MQPTTSEHHYAFAHYALRRLALASPVTVLGNLAIDSRRTSFIDCILADVDIRIGGNAPRTFTASDIRYTGHRIGNRCCAVLEMPAPTNPCEAYFIAIVAPQSFAEALQRAIDADVTEPLFDYYVLERPVKITQKTKSMFCAWAGETHRNYGDGPAPTLEAFVPFLTAHVIGDSALEPLKKQLGHSIDILPSLPIIVEPNCMNLFEKCDDEHKD